MDDTSDVLLGLQRLSVKFSCHRRRADCVIEGATKMKCPICAKAELIQDVREIPYTYNVENTTSPAVPGLWRGHPRSDRRRAYAS